MTLVITRSTGGQSLVQGSQDVGTKRRQSHSRPAKRLDGLSRGKHPACLGEEILANHNEQANNISAAQIRDEYERRLREAGQDENAGEGASNATPQQATATPSAVDTADEVAEEEEEKTKKRKRSQKEAIDKIKKAKASKKPKKKGKGGGSDEDDDDYDDDFATDMYKKAKPMPGQFEHCEICSKRFTVTPYSKEGPEGGLLCTPCGKELAKEQKQEKKAASKPTGRKRRKLESDRLDGIASGGAKSLMQLCIEKVAKHHEDVEELGDIPPTVLEKLSEIFSKKRVMKSRTLRLFLRPDLQSVIVHDAAYLELEDYRQMFAIVPNMRRLVLANACQMKDEAVEYMIERCHKLQHLQLYAANLITNDMWARLFQEMGQELEVVKLKWLDASFEDHSVREMVQCCPRLERVKLKLCRRIGEDAVAALAELPNLKHLSLQIGRPVPIDVLCSLVVQRGAALRTLSLEKFLDADDSILQTVHDNCNVLSKFRFCENDTATDAGYTALFTNWRNPALTFVDINSTRDVDNNNPEGPEEAIGIASPGFRALMAHSGSAIRHLDIASCRHIELSAFMDVFNGAQTYPMLEHINVSFCNRVDTSVVVGIFKSCPALKKLVAFGCFDVQDVVVPRDCVVIGIPRAADAIEQFGVGIGGECQNIKRRGSFGSTDFYTVDEAIGRMVEVGA